MNRINKNTFTSKIFKSAKSVLNRVDPREKSLSKVSINPQFKTQTTGMNSPIDSSYRQKPADTQPRLSLDKIPLSQLNMSDDIKGFLGGKDKILSLEKILDGLELLKRAKSLGICSFTNDELNTAIDSVAKHTPSQLYSKITLKIL